jgi:hypothetical protein
MSSIAEWFSRKRGRGQPSVEIELPGVQDRLAEAVPRLEGKEVEPDLMRAQLADHYRDLAVEPLLPSEFDALTAGMDDESWRRLALAIDALAVDEVRRALPKLLDGDGVRGQVEAAFVGLARGTPLLTLELLRQSALRVEEFARHFVARLGASVLGETPAQSRARLERLDYTQLLAEAERAKVSAADRMAYLKKLQEKQEALLARRGKW